MPRTAVQAHMAMGPTKLTSASTTVVAVVHRKNYHYHAAAPPAAWAPAAAPPSSVAQQLADVKAMFEQGLIPSREIYEAKVLQILGLP